jgi:hypothetical protein
VTSPDEGNDVRGIREKSTKVLKGVSTLPWIRWQSRFHQQDSDEEEASEKASACSYTIMKSNRAMKELVKHDRVNHSPNCCALKSIKKTHAKIIREKSGLTDTAIPIASARRCSKY